jgi:hypothetical protein
MPSFYTSTWGRLSCMFDLFFTLMIWNEINRSFYLAVQGRIEFPMIHYHACFYRIKKPFCVTQEFLFDCSTEPIHLGRVCLPGRRQPAWTSPARLHQSRPNRCNHTLFGPFSQLSQARQGFCLFACIVVCGHLGLTSGIVTTHLFPFSFFETFLQTGDTR